jgi:hypothetical protein
MCSVQSCASSTPRVDWAAAIAAPAATAFGDEPTAMVRYHSKRLSLSLPLPKEPDWVVDDRSRDELVATRAATHSTVVVAVFRTDTVVGRDQCERLARDRGLLPSQPMLAIEDAVAVTQSTFDTRIVVGLEPGSGPDRPVKGHVLAFGGFLRKCYVLTFSTQVDRADQEAALSSRLAFVRARILPGLELDSLDGVRRPPVSEFTPGR